MPSIEVPERGIDLMVLASVAAAMKCQNDFRLDW